MNRRAALFLALLPALPMGLWAAVAATALPALAQPPELTTFAATYRVEYKGTRVGQSVIALRPDAQPGVYIYESRTEPRGLARLVRGGTLIERSRFVLDGDRLSPLDFTFDDGTRKGDDDNRVVFDAGKGEAVSTYRGQTHRFDLEQPTLDRLLSQLALMRDMAAGAPAAAYPVVDRSAVKTYEVRAAGSERIDTPAGSYDAVVMQRQREGSSRATLIWFAPDLDWLPVRMRQTKNGEAVTELTLESVAGLPAG